MKRETNYTIRKAQPSDAEHCVPIIIEVIGPIANNLSGSNDPDITREVLSDFFGQADNRLSYQNCIVAVLDSGDIVGVLVAYCGSQTKKLDQPYIDRIWQKNGQRTEIVKEAQDDEYYLDTIGVVETHRGMGIGAALIRQFEQQAAAEGHTKLGLLADEENTRAQKLYQSMGYCVDGKLWVCGHFFWHLSKHITA